MPNDDHPAANIDNEPSTVVGGIYDHLNKLADLIDKLNNHINNIDNDLDNHINNHRNNDDDQDT